MDILLHWISHGLSLVVPFIVLLGILIFVHELGHFLVARWCGVRVEVFSLGFGKKILKYKKGDTTYALSLIPLGGYVKMFGEQPGDHIKEEDKSVSFTHKNVWQRIAVVIAGPLMNFFFAIVLFFAVAIMGETARKPVVGDVDGSSLAYRSGFRAGDTLLKINNSMPVESWEDLQKFLSLKTSHDVNFSMDVKRADSDKVETLNVTAAAKPNPNILSRYDYIAEVDGLTPYARGTMVGVSATSPLYTLGLRSGDMITAVNGHPVEMWRDLEKALATANPKEKLVLEAAGLVDNHTLTPGIKQPGFEWAGTSVNGDTAEGEPKKFTLTLAPTQTISSYSMAGLHLESSDLYLAKVMEKSPAQDAGLKEGDRITEINHKALNKWEDVIENIKSYDGKNPVQIKVIRGEAALDLAITPKMSTQPTAFGGEEKRFTIGIVPYANLADPDVITVKAKGLGDAIDKGVSRTWDMSIMTVMSFVRLFENKISPKHIGGVISIGQAASETFKMGMSQFLQMMAIISVNLFIMNLLPVPVLDGGHLLFYVIEVVKGAPVSLKKMEIAQQVGLAILMSLMVFALFNDFTRVLGL